ncbi:metal ABC transporter solute-binding protein, Zn/Mn family [Globicatella sanguinis]|uniref:metal ABC transporter solute-binding protein, Zn/Mn family n=1 Tax=Globicatella sanguinis TaxID=13076 RepID=UPI002543A85A|nr:zinc ABC transporter substrate-binding protein [Globicatella sanguinis]MDK7631680.1 zinc ABC transporter substrate-binding protein [Globicatella sanguinis]WIK65834.1 zinc ABC transporter substrate-binding protein [Globicatella sanguinis]WKT55239.1 zinc ABC transporter substrate-binding protein [Globicatella sanguinis]
MNNLFKRSLVVLVALALMIGGLFVSTPSAQAEAEKLDVVVTTTHMKDLLEVVGGEHVKVTGLMGPGVDPHGYEPTPSDIDAVNNADLVGYNGLHLEAMFTDIFEKMAESDDVNIFSLEEALKDGQVLDYVYEDKDLDLDPHIWFDIQIWQQATQLVADKLAEVDPDNAKDYQANADAYVKELDELDKQIADLVAEVPEESRYLVTAHDAFSYFGKNYGFNVESIQGLNTQTEAGTGDIAKVADLVIDKKIKACFIESSVSDRNVKALVEAVEAKGGNLEIGGELYSDALGTDEEKAGNYIDAYVTNISTIVNALK